MFDLLTDVVAVDSDGTTEVATDQVAVDDNVGSANSKDTVAHEYGHLQTILVPSVQNPPRFGPSDIDYGSGGTHSINSIEWQSAASIEGISTWYAVATWHDVDLPNPPPGQSSECIMCDASVRAEQCHRQPDVPCPTQPAFGMAQGGTDAVAFPAGALRFEAMMQRNQKLITVMGTNFVDITGTVSSSGISFDSIPVVGSVPACWGQDGVDCLARRINLACPWFGRRWSKARCCGAWRSWWPGTPPLTTRKSSSRRRPAGPCAG